MKSTEAETTASAITACAVQGEVCSPSSLDSASATVLTHTVFLQACSDAHSDLHVMRYLPPGNARSVPLVATWCT